VRVLEGRKRMAHLHTEGALTEHQPREEADQKESKKEKRRAETVKDKTQRHGR